MALIFLGYTECALCGKVLADGDDIFGLPSSSNKEHILYKYFDSGFHLTCFENWDKKNEILKLISDDDQV